MYYPEELIEDIRIHNDIYDVISSYVTLKKKGSSYFGLCPFHNEKTPSFSVSPDKQMYYCFGCGAGGNVYTFVMDYENFSFIEAVRYLADRVGISLPTVELSDEERKKMDRKQQLLDINKLTARYFYYQLKSDKGKKALEYLINRGLSKEIITKFGLGYSNLYRDDLYRYLKKKGYEDVLIEQSGVVLKDQKQGLFDRFWNRVMFPIFDVHNRVIGFGGRVLGDGMPKYLNSPETSLFDKSKNLYGLNLARTSRKTRIIIVEGYMDVISLHQAGFNEAVASLGTALTSGQARLLKRYTDEVLLSYDSDEAGVKAALRAIPILKDAGLSVKIMSLKPYKDPDELIKSKGKEAFEDCIVQGKNSLIFEIEVLEKGYNLTDPEQKTYFIEKMAEKILELQSEIERDNYIEALSNKYKMNQGHFRKLIDERGARIGIVTPKKSSSSKISKDTTIDGIKETQRLLLAYMINNPFVFNKVKDYIQPSDFKNPIYFKVAEIVYQHFSEQMAINPAKIINRFMVIEEQKEVANLFNKPIDEVEPMALEKIINEIVYKLKRYSLDYDSRNAKDIQALQALIVEQSKLQKLHISLNDG